jgi:hypothetical protein
MYNTPTQLTRFLRDCEDNFGIPNATTYESPLRWKSYGPDILHRVSDTALAGIGIPTGDVIRLKDASGPWYNGPSAKCRRIKVEKSVAVTQTVVSYEKRWHDVEGNLTGASCFWGPPMQGRDPQLEVGLEIWYRCTAHNDWFIVPRGYEAQEEGTEEDF